MGVWMKENEKQYLRNLADSNWLKKNMNPAKKRKAEATCIQLRKKLDEFTCYPVNLLNLSQLCIVQTINKLREITARLEYERDCYTEDENIRLKALLKEELKKEIRKQLKSHKNKK